MVSVYSHIAHVTCSSLHGATNRATVKQGWILFGGGANPSIVSLKQGRGPGGTVSQKLWGSAGQYFNILEISRYFI